MVAAAVAAFSGEEPDEALSGGAFAVVIVVVAARFVTLISLLEPLVKWMRKSFGLDADQVYDCTTLADVDVEGDDDDDDAAFLLNAFSRAA